jgi:hypothetical protein
MELKLSTEYLQELFDYEGKSLVGKILKRFEIIDEKEVLKREIKEIIYEEIRQIRNLLLAGGRGLDQTVFKFNNFNKERE